MTSAGNAPGATNYPNLPDNWSDSIPNAPSPIGNNKLYSCKGIAQLGGTLANGFTFQYTWEKPVLQAQTKQDISKFRISYNRGG